MLLCPNRRAALSSRLNLRVSARTFSDFPNPAPRWNPHGECEHWEHSPRLSASLNFLNFVTFRRHLRLTHPDGQAFYYRHDGLDRLRSTLANDTDGLYAWTGAYSVTRGCNVNGLNRLTATGTPSCRPAPGPPVSLPKVRITLP
jgi:hypothetical protein